MEYVDFYKGLCKTKIGDFNITDVMQFSDDRLEREHTYIQWIFPMPTLSRMQPGAATQILTEEAIVAFREDEDVMDSVECMTRRMLRFWGMCWEFETNAFVYIENEKLFLGKLRDGNHNQARMTRMLTFLRCIGWHELVDAIKQVLKKNSQESRGGLSHWNTV